MKHIHTRLGVGAIAITVVAGVVAVPAAQAQTRQSEAKNIILFIGDGMGRTHVTAGRKRF